MHDMRFIITMLTWLLAGLQIGPLRMRVIDAKLRMTMDLLSQSLKKTRARFIRTSMLLFTEAVLIAGTPYVLMDFFNHATSSGQGSGSPFTESTASATVSTLAQFQHHVQLLGQHLGFSVFQSDVYVSASVVLLLGFALSWLSKLEETAPLEAALAAMNLWRQSLLERLLRGRLSYFETHSARDLAARLSDDGILVESLLVSSLKAFSKSMPLLILMFCALAYHSTTLAVGFAIVVVPFYWVAAIFVRADWVRSQRSDLETAHDRHEIERSLFMIPSLKSLSIESEVLLSLGFRSERADEQTLLSRRARGSLAGSVVIAKHVLRASLLIFGAELIRRGAFAFGPFLMFAFYSELMPSAVIEIARCLALARSAAPAIERLRGLAASLENEEELEGGRKTSSLPFPDADVLIFEGVSFSEGMPPWSAEFEPGELIAIVGTQSSSRSTFGRLLNRLNDPAQGSISIGRTGLKSFSLELLRRTVTLVDRSPFFMTASVKNNLALAVERDTDLDERLVNEALRSAGVDFINDLPDKLETIIGETAYRLTEGEYQRLSVARALLRSTSRIFFFDEVTAALDLTEARTVFEAAQTLAENGALVFWVTRRADETVECDRIVYLDQAADRATSVVIDTPDALMTRSSGYRTVLGLRENVRQTSAQTAQALPKSSARRRGPVTELTPSR